MSRFKRHNLLVHLKTDTAYMVILGPDDGLVIEATGEPAYLYQRFWRVTDQRLWVRPASEMEDGRFTIKATPTHGAEGRLPT